MSTPVDVADLAKALRDFDSGYLLTTAAGRVKAVTVEVRVTDSVLDIPGGSRGSAANLARNPSATLLFPPRQRHGYTLLVDGTAEARNDGFRFTPATAVLHRPSAYSDGPTPDGIGAEQAGSCDNDCVGLS
ncbi:MAG: pyridoxamine 5'-phosphate oxidase [Micrococcales bacterium]|nr:pyridoxamine 5'-phosphate oxidase [Micrococcales bacterium]